VRGDFGSISIVLALLWALFTAMLLISWLVIRRMVRNMYTLQNSLQWQAWHDPLTRLNNRGALFERAKQLAETCQQQSLPFSVIQIDLDHFKNINDLFGHQAGIRYCLMLQGSSPPGYVPAMLPGVLVGRSFVWYCQGLHCRKRQQSRSAFAQGSTVKKFW
jgi:hypothetical protein